jgi:hypothetical protein
MKELDAHKKEEIAVHAQKQQEKQHAFIGQFRPHPGQKIWQIDLKTLEVTPAEIDEAAVNIEGEVQKKIIVKEKHLYCVAINKKNALRKFDLQCKVILENIQK